MTRALRRLASHTIRQSIPPTLVDRYAGTVGVAALAWHPLSYPIATGIALVDTTDEPEITIPVDEVGWWHPLWTRDEPAATVRIAGSPALSIAPGDAKTLASGTSSTFTGGQLGVLVTVPGASSEPSTPTHGIDSFHGHQRHTALPAPHGVEISRWKLTDSIRLDRHHRGPVIVITLAGEPVLASSREVLPVARGSAVLVDLSAKATVHPGALAYLLVIQPAE